MTVEQHAEALVKHLKDNSIPEVLTESELHTAAIAIIAKHMQAAIDEATAALKARIADLEGLGPLIDEYGSASWNDGYNAAEGQRRSSARGEVKAKIDAILKGGAS